MDEAVGTSAALSSPGVVIVEQVRAEYDAVPYDSPSAKAPAEAAAWAASAAAVVSAVMESGPSQFWRGLSRLAI